MRHRFTIGAVLALLLGGCASEATLREQSRIHFDPPQAAPITSTTLETFAGQQEVSTYLRRVAALRDAWAAARLTASKATMTAQEEVDCTLLEDCESEKLDSIMVTGSRISTPSITNNQTVGVDEGDLVKQIGDYFLILQDGRIFAVHAPTLRLTDRVDVYRPRDPARPKKYRWEDDFDGADWYDEMLVHGQQVIVSACSYSDHATEISIFELDSETGQLQPRTRHLLSSNDYYSSSNYALRIVGDMLILRTSQPLDELADWPAWTQQVPVSRTFGTLLSPRAVFKPLLPTFFPWLHQITYCRLNPIEANHGLDCDAVGFVGPQSTEFYVSPAFIYLWNTAGDEPSLECEDIGVRSGERVPAREVPLAAVYRISLRDQSVTVASARGWMSDQFHLDEYQGRLRAVVDWAHGGCYSWGHQRQTSFIRLHGSDFGIDFGIPATARFTPLPAMTGNDSRARFIDEWVVLGTVRDPDDEDDVEIDEPPLVVLQASQPERAARFDPGHEVSRIERLDTQGLIVGPDRAGNLGVTVLAFGERAESLASITLEQRREGESRSHAFNFTVDGDETILGLPTQRYDRAARWHWDDSSDLSYLRLRDGQLTTLGEITLSEAGRAEAPGYRCEVSCIDWYGNARPIFSAVGWFGLMGTELVRVGREQDRVRAGARLDLTRPPMRTTGTEPR
ncbi:MAG: beta-propeller domain-containing protein [Xanthomonadales bacterium]|jgi:hypothetical protein|nr:beta-propeller domain-containing protein [Xanthomonadales bacterium]